MPSWLDEIKKIVGSSYVLTNPLALHTYSQDGYTLTQGRPRAVILPSSPEQCVAVVKCLSKHKVPLVARGAGTSLSGGAIPSEESVVMHFSRMNHILGVDWTNQVIEVEPGVINADISQYLGTHGYFYAPDPSSQQACTIGGNFAENSGGPHCLKYGVTVNHIVMADVILPDGTVRRFGNLTRTLCDGPDWLGLMIGSEGTLGIAVRLWLRILPLPKASRTVLALYDDVHEASQTVSDIIASGIVPSAMEMMDRLAISAVERGAYPVGYPSDLAAVLLIEVDGDESWLTQEVEQVLSICQSHHLRSVRQPRSAQERNLWWSNRKTAFGAMGLISPRYYVQDGVIPRHVLPDALSVIQDLSETYGIRIANVFHAGDGNLHPLLLYDDQNPEEVSRVIEAGSRILQYCVKVGGSITGEHGIGLEKLREMSVQYTPADLKAQQAVKDAFDPNGLFNPGKLLPTPGQCIDYTGM